MSNAISLFLLSALAQQYFQDLFVMKFIKYVSVLIELKHFYSSIIVEAVILETISMSVTSLLKILLLLLLFENLYLLKQSSIDKTEIF